MSRMRLIESISRMHFSIIRILNKIFVIHKIPPQ